jgi:transposase
MARALGPRKVHRYSEEFKATAVRLSALPGVEGPAVADALAIHPFMLSRWRKEAREGRIVARGKAVDIDSKKAGELHQLRDLKRAHNRLKVEHDLLKKAIRCCSERRQRSSRSLRAAETTTP